MSINRMGPETLQIELLKLLGFKKQMLIDVY